MLCAFSIFAVVTGKLINQAKQQGSHYLFAGIALLVMLSAIILATVFAWLFFIPTSFIIAALLTVYMPGNYGAYTGSGFVALTFLILLFPREKAKIIRSIKLFFKFGKIKVGPFKWTKNDFCRGWLITGQTGSGKTVCAIKTIITSLFRDCPEWCGVIVDQKGQFYRIVEEIAQNYKARNKLIILDVNDETNKYNLLSYPNISLHTYAGIIVDAADSVGVKFDPFWKNAAAELITVMLMLIKINKTPTFEDLYYMINDSDNVKAIISELTLMSDKLSDRDKQLALTKLKTFMDLAEGQRDGILGSCKQLVGFFALPEIRKVFCPDVNTVDFIDMEKGKIFILKMGPKYNTERNYFNTFLKLLFGTHSEHRLATISKRSNLLVFIADEAQMIVTSSAGASDHKTLSMTRESKATYILATQSTTSLSVELKDKFKALMVGMSNYIFFTVTDKDAAIMASDVFGDHTVTKTSKTVSRGITSTTYREVEEPIYKPSELRGLEKYQCIIKHANGPHAKVYMPPVGKKGQIPFYYYRDRFDAYAWLLYLLQV